MATLLQAEPYPYTYVLREYKKLNSIIILDWVDQSKYNVKEKEGNLKVFYWTHIGVDGNENAGVLSKLEKTSLAPNQIVECRRSSTPRIKC